VLVAKTRHYPNIFAISVGETTKARKGTSWNRALNRPGFVGGSNS
jgi:hypothetical protein